MQISTVSINLLLLVIVLSLLGPAIEAQQPTYLYHSCPNTTTFTVNSTYQANRNTVLTSLSSNSTRGDGFYNTTAGRSPDVVYGLFLCRGDLSTSVCQACVTFATTDISQLCPNQTTAVVWYDQCLLRYSNRNIFSVVAEEPAVRLRNTQNANGTEIPFDQLVAATVVMNMNDITTQTENKPAEEEKQNKSNRIPVLVASLSAIFGLAVVFISGFFIWRRRNRRDKENSQEVQLLDLVNEHSRETFNGESGERSREFLLYNSKLAAQLDWQKRFNIIKGIARGMEIMVQGRRNGANRSGPCSFLCGFEVLKCIHIGLLCVHEDPADRPTMSSVIFMLASDSTITLLCPSEPAFSVGRAIAKPTEPISDDRVFSVNEVTISNFSPR
ncbi:hypothetical protein PVK06_033158 [Gossypium arboreum]|uniref:Gnk2-homologous domain-containing protein n=1 Tax=Gossypium arboreum TaxID=29729 RepID=A0ABR0NB63_GOSAR|nr:hypothetical protein PVK06_033158 [Gossypium arboreum]